MAKRKHFKCKSEAQKKAIRRSYAEKSKQDKQDKKAKSANSTGNNTTDNFVMWLAKIPNKYLFDSSKPQDLHTYAVYKDDETKEVRAIETTHLYIPDKHNMDSLHKGLLRKVKFAGYETPSGVHNTYFNKDIKGNPIDLGKQGISIDKTPLPYETAKAIKDFAKNPRNSD